MASDEDGPMAEWLEAIAMVEARLRNSREDYGAIVRGTMGDAHTERLMLALTGVATVALQITSEDPQRVLNLMREHELGRGFR